MKKLITLILGIAFIYSCSTSTDGNGNSTTTVVPFVPSNLTGTVVSSTQINLSWTDNSTNETGFKIERKTGSGTYAVVGTTATDVTTFSDIGLTASTTYTYRVYSYNVAGNSLSYSNELTLTTNSTAINVPGPNLTDIDGNIYQSVTICSQNWTKQNLNVSRYSDGTLIPQVIDFTQWASLTTGAWCYYNNITANGITYGKLYNWYAVAGIYDTASAANASLRKKLAPTGWHIPSGDEWSSLINCLDPNANGGNNSNNLAGGKMKSIGISLWESPNTDATNLSGFTALPGGFCQNVYSFGNLGRTGIWWSSTGNNTTFGTSCSMFFNSAHVIKGNIEKVNGFSVRCVKD